MSLEILPFTASDIPRGLQIHDRALNPLQSPVTNLLFNPPATPQSMERQMERFTSGPDSFLFKAVENGVIIGYLSARKVSKVSDPSLVLQRSAPSWHETCGISKTAWEKCFEMRAEARKESFDYTIDHLRTWPLSFARISRLRPKLTDRSRCPCIGYRSRLSKTRCRSCSAGEGQRNSR